MTAPASRNAFVGTWKLLTMTARSADGRERHPYGEAPLGYITYTGDGTMHAILMHARRARVGQVVEEVGRRRGARRAGYALTHLPELGRLLGATLQSTAYSARWDIRGNEVVHRVTAAIIPDWIGTDLVRTYALDGDRLTLTAHYPGGTSLALVWQKT